MKDTSPMAVSASIGRLGSLVADPERVRMIRKNLGLTVQDDLRIAYVGGGNMAGTFNQWLRGEHDKGVPVITYSGMMFDIAETLGASLLVGSDFPSQESVAYHDKITFLQLPAPSGSGRLERRLSRIRAGAAAIQGINQFDPHFTIVGADFHWSAIPFLKGIKILSIHCSFWPIDSQPQGLRTKGELCYKGFIYKHFIRGAIGTSASCARQIQQLTDASLVTDSEVPQYSFDPGVKPSRDLQSPVRVLFVGRMEWDKGIEDLLHAVAQLNEEQVLATLTFVGDGSALTAFRKEAELVGKEWVTLAGRLPAREVFQGMQAADILVCPTRREFLEGLALVCVEAMAVGTPSIMSSVVPAYELLGEAGLTFPAGDVAALRDQLLRFIREPELREKLHSAAVKNRKQFMDRSKSWGSRLLKLMADTSAG